MDSRSNVIAMMVLGAGIVALGSTIISGEAFKTEKSEKPGYIVEGVEAEGDAAGPAAVVVPIATLLATADPAKGADVFKKCASCHNAAQGGANGIGPNLWGIIGNKHAHSPTFAYSEGMKAKPGNWDFDAMNAWLTKPSAYVKGTKMNFAGLSKPEDRANVIAYLNTQGSNLPYPAPPAAGATPPAPSPDKAPAPAGAQGAPASGGATATPPKA